MPIRDREIVLSTSWTLAIATWLGTLAVWLLSWARDDIHLGQLALIVAAAAITMTVRCYLCTVTVTVRNAVRADRIERGLTTVRDG